MFRFAWTAVIAVALVWVLSAAAPAWAQGEPPAAAPADSVARVLPDYHLGSGDKLRVITFGEEALTGEFFVGGSGKVSLPLVGEVQAAGLTLPEFQAEVEGALKGGYLKEPKVAVEVLNYRPFYILGEV